MTKPAPILFTIPNFITAGSGRAMLNIIERLDRSKFSPAVCVLKKGGALDKEVERMKIPFLEVPFLVLAKPYWTLLARAQRAAEIFKPFNFKLWHSFNYSDDYTEALIARFSGAKYIYTKKNMNWDRRAWYLRSFLASGIAAQNTDMIKKFFSGFWLRGKSTLIARGVHSEKFKANPAGLVFRKSLKIPENAQVMTCVGHLLPVKGHPTLLNALADVPENVHLIVAGEPMDRVYAESLRILARDLGIQARVHFLGAVSDVPALFSETDIAVLPTWDKWRMEGCPVALLEAMSCAKACIATNIPGSRDIIEDGRNGLLVQPQDPSSLAKAVQKLTQSQELRLRLGQAARKTILEKYTIEREVADHERLYQEILNGK